MKDLDKFKNEMNLSGQNVYVGHRYVPKIEGEWDKTKLYEPLSIVQYQGNSFTSRQYVPVGVEITNEEYWASTGNYNAQIEQYRQDVQGFNNDLATLKTDTENELTTMTNNIGDIQSDVDNVKFFVNVKEFGAKGDGLTDDREAIQAAIDEVFNAGGGIVYLPMGTYLINAPLLLKSPSEDGGYDFNFVEIRGEGNRKSRILKNNTATETVKNGTANEILDATIIGIGGITENLNAPVTGVKFKDIKISNLSTGLTTYGVYIARGSRILADYSSFETLRTTTDLASHNRYAFFAGSTWSTSYRDTTFHGDYGFYQSHNSTSLLMENVYSSGLKSSYKITSTYTTLINAFGDYAQGTMFNFHYASVNVISMGA